MINWSSNGIFRKSKSADHKNQLARLEEKDPEFFKFLKENDKELLDFNDSDTGSEVESDDDDHDNDEDDDDKSRDSKNDKKDKKVGIFAGKLTEYYMTMLFLSSIHINIFSDLT